MFRHKVAGPKATERSSRTKCFWGKDSDNNKHVLCLLFIRNSAIAPMAQLQNTLHEHRAKCGRGVSIKCRHASLRERGQKPSHSPTQTADDPHSPLVVRAHNSRHSLRDVLLRVGPQG